MYHNIFFDLDGTLTDSKEGILNCVRYALERLGEPIPEERELLKFIGPPLQDSFRDFCGFSPERTREAVRLFRERYAPIGKFENRPTPGAAELCARLKAEGRALAIASCKPERMCQEICRRFEFTPSMETITGSPPEADWTKEHIIQETMRRLGLGEPDRSRTLMIGDRKFDVVGAKACGIDCVGVEFFGYAEPGELEAAGAVAVVKNLEELEAFLAAH